MTEPKNVMEIFKILEKTNCRKCDESTCLAFASAVFKGEKALKKCPYVGREWLDVFESSGSSNDMLDNSLGDALAQLRDLMPTIKIDDAAIRLGGRVENDKLIVKVLGKDLSVDANGNVASDIHIHSWLMVPIVDYLKKSQGVSLSGRWVPVRELVGGRDWDQFFSHRCEKPLKALADKYTDLFEDMIHIFNGKQVKNHYKSDISLILTPLPNLPMLICYWKPEDGLDSSLNFFFDDTAEKNLPIESIYLLASGMLVMFEKIALRHGAT